MKKLLTLALAAAALLPLGDWNANAQESRSKFEENFLKAGNDTKGDETETPATPGASDYSYQGSSSVERAQYEVYMDLIKKACAEGAIIIRQPYVVVDASGAEIALENENDFGHSCSLGIRVIGGYVFGPQAMNPWDYDSEFEANKNPGDRPKLMAPTKFAELGDEAEYNVIEFSGSKAGHILPGSLYSMRDPMSIDGDGFLTTRSTGSVKGYIVWFCNPGNKDLDKTTALQLSVIPYTYEIDKDLSKLYDLPDKYVKNPLGAIYVVPEVTATSQVNFNLYGVGIQEKGEWKMLFPFADDVDIYDMKPIISAPADPVPDNKGTGNRRRRKVTPKADVVPAAVLTPAAAVKDAVKDDVKAAPEAAPEADAKADAKSDDSQATAKKDVKADSKKDKNGNKSEADSKKDSKKKDAKKKDAKKTDKPAKTAKPSKPAKADKPAQGNPATPEADDPDNVGATPESEPAPAAGDEPTAEPASATGTEPDQSVFD